jgi:hypothetical protein
MRGVSLWLVGLVLVGSASGACKKEDDQDVATRIATLDDATEGAELARFGTAIAWLRQGYHSAGLTLVEEDGQAHEVHASTDQLLHLAASADALYFMSGSSLNGPSTSNGETLFRYRRGDAHAEALATAPAGGFDVAPVSNVVVYRDRLLYCKQARVPSPAPIVAMAIPVAATGSTPAWTTELALQSAYCTHLEADETYLYIESSRGILRAALADLDATFAMPYAAPHTEEVFPWTVSSGGYELLGVGPSDVYVLVVTGAGRKVVAVPKTGGPSRDFATLPASEAVYELTHPVLSRDSTPTVYYVDRQTAGQHGAAENGDRVVKHEAGGTERELTVAALLKALAVDGSRLIYVSDEVGHEKASLRALARQ